MVAQDLTIFTKSYDFLLWLMGHTMKFPKSSRFTLAARLENRMLDVLMRIMRANRMRDKRQDLAEADMALEQVRILVRMGKDLRFLSLSSYEYAARQLDEIGRLLGGWLKQQKQGS